MTVHDTPGAPCWIELFTSDQARSVDFYTGLFGWTAGEPSEEFGGYLMFFEHEQPVAGCMVNDGSSGTPDTWSTYLESRDVEATAQKAAEAGGQVVVAPMTIATLGRMVMVVDPAGAAIGAWEPHEFGGFARLATPGTPGWFETLSDDYDASVDFYRDVFGWEPHTMSDTEDFRYTTLGADDQAKAGIMDAAGFLQGQPSRWQFYVIVEDTDATVERARELGAAVVRGPEDSPYGRLAHLTDPLGTAFSVMGSGAGSA